MFLTEANSCAQHNTCANRVQGGKIGHKKKKIKFITKNFVKKKKLTARKILKSENISNILFHTISKIILFKIKNNILKNLIKTSSHINIKLMICYISK